MPQEENCPNKPTGEAEMGLMAESCNRPIPSFQVKKSVRLIAPDVGDRE